MGRVLDCYILSCVTDTELYRQFLEAGAHANAAYKKSDLRTAITSFDAAIGLGEALDLEVPEFRDALASAYMGRGIAQKALGTPTDLHAAIASYDQAISVSVRAIHLLDATHAAR